MKNYNIEQYNEDTDNRRIYEEGEAYLRAKKKLDKLVGFYWHLAVYIIVNIFLIFIIGTQSGEGFWHFGTFATPFFWGIGLGFHFLGVFGPNLLFGKGWEDKKIKEYMSKDEEEIKRFE